MNFLDIFTIVSYMGLNADIIFQIIRIRKTRSSRDISLVGLSIRYAAILIILAKFASINDVSLIAGQTLILLSFTTYFLLAFFYYLKDGRR